MNIFIKATVSNHSRFIYNWEKSCAAFPSSHVAISFLLPGGQHFEKIRIPYWLTCLTLSIATVYCMFHYAVDVIAGLIRVSLCLRLTGQQKRYCEKPHRGTCKE
jgi:membrane-associated phospholipid phosphatase